MRPARSMLVALLAIGLQAAAAESIPKEKVIQVTARKFEFSPAVIELKLGVPVVLELTSLDREHGFKQTELHLDETVAPGKVTRVRLVPDKAGTFEFYCSVFCGSGHEEMGGRIVVKP